MVFSMGMMIILKLSELLTAMIEQAIQKKTAVHVILPETSFSGDIVKHDANRQQIIVKNFSKT